MGLQDTSLKTDTSLDKLRCCAEAGPYCPMNHLRFGRVGLGWLSAVDLGRLG